MITFFTTGKPFTGHNGVIQRNALKSWTLAVPDAEVILFGDEEGAAKTALELGIRHVAQVQRLASDGGVGQGPKVLRSFFDAAQRMARHEIVCYANCDIVFADDFADAVGRARSMGKEFLMVGRRWDTDLKEAIHFERAEWGEGLRKLASAEGQERSGDWIDYFVFPKGFYLGKLPELVIGRVHWDQWLVWKAKNERAAVIDASEAVMAIHQNHDYGYHAAGKSGVWTDEFPQRNYRLAGGSWHFRTIDGSTRLLRPHGIQ